METGVVRFSMTARVAPAALRARRAAGLASGCALPKRVVVVAGVTGLGGLGFRLVFELVGCAFPGRDVGARTDIDRLVDGAALLQSV